MHLVFISSILTLSHTGLYPSSPAPWPSPTNFILKSNETHNPNGCSRHEVLEQIHGVLNGFRRGIIESIAQVKEQNLIISPLAASLALSLVTSNPVEKGTPSTKLHSGVDCLRMMGMQPLFDYLRDYESTGLYMASCVFVSPKLALRPEYIETVTKTFRTPLRQVDFENSEERTDFINRWGAEEITNLVNPDTSLALVNAINFEGEWALKFNVNDTVVHDVDCLGNTTHYSYMHMTANLRHGRYPKANAYFYELPFKSEDGARNMSMFVVIPDRVESDKNIDVIDNIEEFNITDLISHGTYGSIPICLRKFTLKSVLDIVPAVKETLAEYDIFDQETTKFSGISESSHLFGDKFVQSVVMEIDEYGCRAATADTFADPTPDVLSTCALPFYAFISTTGDYPQIIFAGRFHSFEDGDFKN